MERLDVGSKIETSITSYDKECFASMFYMDEIDFTICESYSTYVIPQSIDDVATVSFSFNDSAMVFSTDLDISSIEAGSVYTYSAQVSTSGAYSYIAGIVAMNMSSGKVDNCLNDGVVYENGSYVTIGGVVGSNYAASSSVSNSTSTSGSVQISGYSTIYNSASNYAIGKQN